MDCPSDNRRQVSRILFLTLILNLSVLAIKSIVGWQTNSLSIAADALHSLTDSANNILGLITTRLAVPHPDREHPYGHSKYDAIGALGIAAFLGIACFEIFQSALERLFVAATPVTLTLPALWLLLGVLATNIFVAIYERKMGRELHSQILIADAHHTASDIWITIVVIAGLIGVWSGYRWLDIALSVPVAFLVLFSGWEVLKTNLPWLIDRMAIAPEAIYQDVMKVPGVTNCHDIASRGLLGRQTFIEMHLIVDATDLKTAHDISEAVEEKLTEKYAPVRITIHMEPPDYTSDSLTYRE
jgi:cation diffusion facilitator family transporter